MLYSNVSKKSCRDADGYTRGGNGLSEKDAY